MPVSSGLQKYFDSRQKKKSQRDIKKKFQDLSGKIDPAFLASFEEFNSKILEIVDQNPESLDIAEQELDTLNAELHNAQRRHNLQKANAVITASETT